MGKIPETYDVHAAITSTGGVERVNTLMRKTFGTIAKVYHNHDEWRWLVVNRTGELSIHVIDLWYTKMHEEFPYVAPHFVAEGFDTADLAVTYVNFELVR